MLTALALFASLPIVSMQTVPYFKTDDYDLKMDVYSSVHQELSPAVLVIHGGAWISGGRSDMADLCFGIARNGATAITIDYRLAPQYKWPAMLEDCQLALRFIQQNASVLNIDRNRVAVTGASAGGHLALLLGTMDQTSGDIKAVLNLFGPTDLRNDFPAFLMIAMANQVLGMDVPDAEETLTAMSPVTYADRSDPPVFTVHGTSDELVPVMQAKRLQEAHPHHTLIEVDGMGHGIDLGSKEEIRAVLQGITFLMEHLGS